MKLIATTLSLVLLLLFATLQSTQKLPGKMVLDDPVSKTTVYSGDKGKAEFDHDQHVAKDACVTCHHTNSEKLTKALEQPVMKCATCHKAEDDICTVEDSREGMTFKGKMAWKSEFAFHGKDRPVSKTSIIGCIGCHEQRNQNLTSCGRCHSQ
jgi:hypothetical protein